MTVGPPRKPDKALDETDTAPGLVERGHADVERDAPLDRDEPIERDAGDDGESRCGASTDEAEE
jgi:hypothetical protein